MPVSRLCTLCSALACRIALRMTPPPHRVLLRPVQSYLEAEAGRELWKGELRLGRS
ncbi:hypothetical protein H920_00875 [Fukomys damarensis]|uniref:Uncharacterized protein n=1 Tax=Fukomys damarensis TaxID=885580 RepID=A0A091E4U5_FUKDA|nr:hypothetical protein H920_00875 [Fukomys damarensis]